MKHLILLFILFFISCKNEYTSICSTKDTMGNISNEELVNVKTKNKTIAVNSCNSIYGITPQIMYTRNCKIN